MLKIFGVLTLIFVEFSRAAEYSNQDEKHCFINDDGKSDEPLFLTPLIEDKNRPRLEIQQMARVDRTRFQDVESYAGYLTVDKKFNSNLFFWYFPPERNVTNAPVILWLQGGPGVSSLVGLFTINGPFKIEADGHLRKHNFSWNQEQHLIFIDNPVGTGFSFTDNEAGYARNEVDVGKNLHEAMMQLYELFEWQDSADFWITGESYGGKYVPALGYRIHKTQVANKQRRKIPLKGLAIGNGIFDPVNQLTQGDYLYQLGLIDQHGLAQFHAAALEIKTYINSRDFGRAFDVFDKVIGHELANNTLFQNISGYVFVYDFLNTHDDDSEERLQKLMNCSGTRRAVHAGNRTFSSSSHKVYKLLKSDVMDTVAPWLTELLSFYKVCFYNGQMDILLPYVVMTNALRKLPFAAAAEYKLAKRHIWYVDGEVAGYTKNAGNLIEILVRNAGHMAPKQQPEWMYDLIYQLTHFQTVQ